MNDRDPMFSDVYTVSIATGDRKLLIKNTDSVGAYTFDLDGNVRLAMKQKEDGGSQFFRVEGEKLIPIYEVSYLESAGPMMFTPDGKKVYFETNKGDDVDLSRLVLLDPMTGKTELVESDPENQVDFGAPIFDSKTYELIGTVYDGDRQRIYARTPEFERDLKLIREKLPPGNIGLMSSTKDMRWHLIAVQSDVDPGSAYLYDRQTGEFTLLYKSRPDLPSENLAEMKAVRYKARDGMEIPALLTLPKGVEAKNLPLVMYPHGGPWARDSWGYEPYAQFLANRGYAVIQPNFRTSTGYGKKFLNAGNHQWGTGAMQHDLTDGVQWLIKEGIADPKRVTIFGGSYGGYATLAGVTFTPDLYKCAIPYVAPSNLITLMESFPAYWRPFLKGSWYLRVGDPADPNDRKDLEARSPINFVDRIKVPLLVVHGANDPRVKQAESDRIVVSLRDKGMPVEYIVAPDEGHGFRSAENRMALAVAMERFLAKNLGGRVQEDVPEKIAARLKEITVDPASVKLPDAAAVAVAETAKTSALPALDGSLLKGNKLAYTVNIEAGGQKMELKVTRTIDAVKDAGRRLLERGRRDRDADGHAGEHAPSGPQDVDADQPDRERHGLDQAPVRRGQDLGRAGRRRADPSGGREARRAGVDGRFGARHGGGGAAARRGVHHHRAHVRGQQPEGADDEARGHRERHHIERCGFVPDVRGRADAARRRGGRRDEVVGHPRCAALHGAWGAEDALDGWRGHDDDAHVDDAGGGGEVVVVSPAEHSEVFGRRPGPRWARPLHFC